MASNSISTSSLQHHISSNYKQQGQAKRPQSLVGSKQVAILNVAIAAPDQRDSDMKSDHETESSAPKFMDERWKKGTWDLNMFVSAGKMNWDSLIEAEAKRRKFLELYPEASTNEEPVLFRSSIIPWWAWVKKSYLPQAELFNGRAAMVGFFMSYVVDALTGLDMVGQTGNLVCKLGLFGTVISVILFRRADDFTNLKAVATEATLYDKQ